MTTTTTKQTMRLKLETYGDDKFELIRQLETLIADIRADYKQGPMADETGERVGAFSISRESVNE